MRKIGIYFLYAVIVFGSISAFCGCQKSELLLYQGGNSVSFWKPTLDYSLYGMNVQELPKDTIELDLAVNGMVTDYDRYVDVVVVPDPDGVKDEDRKNTAVEGKDYNLLGGVIKANEEYGKYKIEIINNDFLKDSSLMLNINIKANKDFEVGLSENKSMTITWTQKIVRPETWGAMRFFFCATYSTQVYKVFMQATGLKEFYYYEGLVNQEEGYVMGRNFGNIVRAYEKEHGTPMLHDDGEAAGTPIEPIY